MKKYKKFKIMASVIGIIALCAFAADAWRYQQKIENRSLTSVESHKQEKDKKLDAKRKDKEQEEKLSEVKEDIDLIMFMGQSNMSGTGNSSEAPEVTQGAGYEYRAVSDPDTLHPITEPFGQYENKDGGINDKDLKTGSLVSSFTNAYYEQVGVPIVGVSASVGGSTVNSWRPGNVILQDCVSRYKAAVNYLQTSPYNIRHRYMVWFQGENDGEKSTSAEKYIESLQNITQVMMDNGIEKCFIIRVGSAVDDPSQYDAIIEAQTQLCKTNSNFIMISTIASSFIDKEGYMRDTVHLTQKALNEIGADAGSHMASYVLTGVPPTMYDAKYDNEYTIEY